MCDAEISVEEDRREMKAQRFWLGSSYSRAGREKKGKPINDNWREWPAERMMGKISTRSNRPISNRTHFA